MASTSEKIMMEFESSADKLSIHLCNRFQTDTQQLDRYDNENVYQQSAARYTYTFKEQLTAHALQLIEEYRYSIEDITHIQQMLTKRIARYANEFNQKLKKF